MPLFCSLANSLCYNIIQHGNEIKSWYIYIWLLISCVIPLMQVWQSIGDCSCEKGTDIYATLTANVQYVPNIMCVPYTCVLSRQPGHLSLCTCVSAFVVYKMCKLVVSLVHIKFLFPCTHLYTCCHNDMYNVHIYMCIYMLSW